VRKKLGRFISPAFYGLFFCTAACLTLLFTMSQWQVGDWAFWQLAGWPRVAVRTLYLTCWGTLFYSLCCSGFGYHTGWLPWWYWVRQKPIPRRPFGPRGAFSLIRHPGYMSFLGLVWFTPDMTSDRALLVGVWTIYIFFGQLPKGSEDDPLPGQHIPGISGPSSRLRPSHGEPREGDFITFRVDGNFEIDRLLFGIKSLVNLQTTRWWIRGDGTLTDESGDRVVAGRAFQARLSRGVGTWSCPNPLPIKQNATNLKCTPLGSTGPYPRALTGTWVH